MFESVDRCMEGRTDAGLTGTVRLPVPGHIYSCAVSKYLLRENEFLFYYYKALSLP